MPNNRKFYPKDAVLYVTSSTEEDLPFIPNIIINAILKGIMARAQYLYGQEICHFVFMANHIHIILKVTNPETVSDLIGYIKGKSGNAINRLLGREKKTVWCDGFDSPIVLTSDTVIEKIIYSYLNPAKARLVDSIKYYPGLSSWKAFSGDKTEDRVLWIRPSTISKLPSVDMTHTQQIKYLTKLRSKNKVLLNLKITPNSWMLSFKSVADMSPEIIKQIIVSRVKQGEQEYAKQGPAMGATKLQKQPLDLKHTRKKRGKRTICLCSDVDIRIRFIVWFKSMSAKACAIFKESRYSATGKSLPPGFFGPGRTLHANFVNFTSWVCC